jgi:DNA polymerase III delta prime subunit
MVKLAFKPTDTSIDCLVSKKPDINFNPFSTDQCCFLQGNVAETTFIPVKQLVGLENASYILQNWYNKRETLQNLMIIGPTGCGKTTLVQSFCEENGIQLYKLNETIKTKKDLLKEIFSFAEYSASSFFIKRVSTQPKLILIDEYQNSQSDVFSISDIHNLYILRNQKLKEQNKKEIKTFLGGLECPFTMPPIVIISADSKGSKLSELKKTHEICYINEIPTFTLKKWVKSLHDLDENVLNELVIKCKSDKRIILHTIEFLKTNKSTDSFIESFHKDIDLTINEFLQLLFELETPLDTIFKIHETDGFMISNLVHENYIDYTDDIHKVADAAEAISIGETLFSDTYESGRTFIPEVHCLHSMYIPSCLLRNPKPNKNIRTSCINNRYNIYLNNLKILKKINEATKISDLDIFDIYTLKTFLNNSLIKTKVLNVYQEDFLKNILGRMESLERMELLYKHFSEFKEKELKTKIFTIKFKEKIKAIK